MSNNKRKDSDIENDAKRPKYDNFIKAKPKDVNKNLNDSLYEAVFKQQGIRGKLVIYHSGSENENVLSTLQNSLVSLGCHCSCEFDPESKNYTFFIGDEEICNSNGKTFENKQTAKIELSKEAYEILRKDCFVLKRNREHIDVKETDLKTDLKTDHTQNDDFNKPGSLAHNMMLKMGWSGSGLGSKEQGRVDNVQVYENVDRQGFGNRNILKEVHKLLSNFANSNKFTILAIDSSFTKGEREAIHKLARRLNLRSKSEGKGDNRKITVSRKINRFDIVKELLYVNCQSSSYNLEIPSNFKHMLEQDT